MKEFISEEEVERALKYLAKSAEDFAKWKSRMKYLELHRKSVRAEAILNAGGSSMAENKERGEVSEAYKQVLKDYEEAVAEFTLIEAYRNAAETKVAAWQTIQASNRRGHV